MTNFVTYSSAVFKWFTFPFREGLLRLIPIHFFKSLGLLGRVKLAGETLTGIFGKLEGVSFLKLFGVAVLGDEFGESDSL